MIGRLCDRTCIERPPIEPRRLWAPVRRRGGEGARGEKAEAVQISMAAGRSARRMLQATICEFVLESKRILLFYTPFSTMSWAISLLLALLRDFFGTPRFLESASNLQCCTTNPTHTLPSRSQNVSDAGFTPSIFPSRSTSRDHHVHLEPSSCRRETTLNWPRSGENAHAQRLFHAWRPPVGARREWPTPLGNLSKCMAWVPNHALERSLCFFSLGMRHER